MSPGAGRSLRTDAGAIDLPSAESVRVAGAGGVELHAVAAGDPEGPLVVLLHGFPDFWWGWRRTIPALAGAGFRVLAPDGRGYNLSGRPDGVDAYRLAALSADVAALIEREGRTSAAVVGHDWGGGVAWDLALRHPGLVDRLAVLNAPHPGVFRRALRRDPRQLRRSWYVGLFLLPRLPEYLLARDDWAGLVRALTESGGPGTFLADELDRYRAAYDRAGSAAGMVNWYRAAVRSDPPDRSTVAAPTLLVWGDDDPALRPALADRSLRTAGGGRLERFPECSHWVHLDAPAAVNDLLVEHCAP